MHNKRKDLIFSWDDLSKFYPYYLQLTIKGNIISCGDGFLDQRFNSSLHFTNYFELKTMDSEVIKIKNAIPIGSKSLIILKSDPSVEISGIFYYLKSCSCIFFSGNKTSFDSFDTSRLQLSLKKNRYRYLYKLVKEVFFNLFENIEHVIYFIKKDNSENIRYLNDEFALTVSNRKGEVLWCNNNFEVLTDFSNAEILGKRPRDSMYGRKSIRVDPNYVDEKIKEGNPFYFENIGYSKYGREYWFGVTVFPIYNRSSELIGRLHVFKNITEKKGVQSSLLKNQALLNLAVENADTIFWTYDIVSNQLELSLKNSPDKEPKLQIRLKEKIATLISEIDFKISTPKFIKNSVELQHDNPLENRYYDFMIKAIEWDTKNNPILFVGALHDVTIQHQQLQVLHEKNNQLSKLNSELEKFVYSASHNLRSPLLSVKALLGLIESGDLSSKKIRSFIRTGITSLENLDNTIIDIIEYSKNSSTELHISTVNPKKILSECIEEVKYICSTNFEFVVLDNSDNTTINSDSTRIKSVFQNIISNAVKYRDDDKDIQYLKITINAKENVLEVCFEDNGIGIEKNMQSKIFEMYFRATNKSVGTGLGLSIVKEVINKLNGKVELKSEYKIGTTFIISLPLKQNTSRKTLLNY